MIDLEHKIWFWEESSQAAISTAFCSNLTGLLENNVLLGCDSVSDERDSGERSLAIVVIFEEGVYIVTAAVVTEVVVAAVVAAMVVQPRLIVAVVAAVAVATVVVAAAVVRWKL